MEKKALVSVIIPTYNSEDTLAKCLESIKNQSYPNIEIIVADHFFGDETRKIAENYGVRILEIKARRSRARNMGVEKARGKLVFFVDSDMELDFSVIDECAKKIRKGYDAVIIPEISVGESFWAKCKALEKSCYIGDDSIESARFFRRSAFESIGGYDQELDAGEDWDLSQRISNAGYRIGRVSALIKHHEGRLSLRDTMLKKYYYGRTLGRYRIKHPRKAKQQLRWIRRAFVKNLRKLVKDPLHASGMLLMKFCESVGVALAAC